ncbi:MAG: hypothetical protein ACLQAT_31790 [Candidatus Binataceae bacterium]
MTHVGLKLLVLAIVLLAIAVILLGPRERSNAVPKPTETAMDYPY